MQIDGIAYIAVVSKDIDKASRLFGEVLGLIRTDVAIGKGRTAPVFSVGDAAIALFETGDPFVGGDQRPGVHHIALSAAQPKDRMAHFKSAGIGVLADA